MKLPFVSRERFEACDAERKRLLDIILCNRLTAPEAEPAEPIQIDPEKLEAAREEVKEQAKATFSAFISRRPSAIVADQTRKAEERFRAKYHPSTNFVAQLETIEREVNPQAN